MQTMNNWLGNLSVPSYRNVTCYECMVCCGWWRWCFCKFSRFGTFPHGLAPVGLIKLKLFMQISSIYQFVMTLPNKFTFQSICCKNNATLIPFACFSSVLNIIVESVDINFFLFIWNGGKTTACDRFSSQQILHKSRYIVDGCISHIVTAKCHKNPTANAFALIPSPICVHCANKFRPERKLRS